MLSYFISFGNNFLLQTFTIFFFFLIFFEREFKLKINFDNIRGLRTSIDIVDAESKKVFVKRNRRVSAGAVKQMKNAGVEYQLINPEHFVGKIASPSRSFEISKNIWLYIYLDPSNGAVAS